MLVKGGNTAPVMKGMAICFVVVMNTALAAAQVGRLIGVSKRSIFSPVSQEMALAGEIYPPNQQEGRAMERRYQLDGPKEATSNKRYRLPDPEESLRYTPGNQ